MKWQEQVEKSDPCGGDEFCSRVSSNPSSLRNPALAGSRESPNELEEGEISPRPSTVEEQRGNDEADNQKIGGHSKSHDGSTSWDALAKKAIREMASGNQVSWATKPGCASSWDAKPWSEQNDHSAGTVASWDTNPWNQQRGRSSSSGGTWHKNKRRSSGSASSWGERPAKERRGSDAGSVQNRDARRVEEQRGTRHQKERRDNASRSTSSRGTRPLNEQRCHDAGSVRNQDSSRVEERRGNKDVRCSKDRDGAEPASYIPHVESSSRRSSRRRKRSRGRRESRTHGIEDLSSTLTKRPGGPQEIVPNTTKDRSSETVFLRPHVDLGSCQASPSVKESKEVTIDRAGDGCAQALDDQQYQPCSSGDALAVKELRGNVEVDTNRAGDGSEDVLHNHLIHSASSRGTSRLEQLSGDQEIIAYRAENRCSIPALHNCRAAFVSSPPSLTEKQATVSHKETDKDGQHGATMPYNLEGVVRVDKKYIYPTDPPQTHAMPSGESYLTKRKLCSSPELARVGPALAIIWTGKFEVPDFPRDSMSGNFLAHSAAIVSPKAYEFANQMARHMQFNIQPHRAFWPKIFKKRCPDNRDVALYIYPDRDPGSRKKYADLLKFLEAYDLMLRAVMDRVELLVYSSRKLDSAYQRLEGSFYLWGVFRELKSKKVGSSTNVHSSPHLNLLKEWLLEINSRKMYDHLLYRKVIISNLRRSQYLQFHL